MFLVSETKVKIKIAVHLDLLLAIFLTIVSFHLSYLNVHDLIALLRNVMHTYAYSPDYTYAHSPDYTYVYSLDYAYAYSTDGWGLRREPAAE